MKSIVKEIFGKKKEGRFIVGINGVDTSGKTTFTKELKKYLEIEGHHVESLSIDDFHNESKIRYRNSDPVEGYINDAFDLVNLEHFLDEIKNKKIENKRVKHLDLETDKFSKTKDYFFRNDTIVLLEGVLLYRPPIEKYVDLKIFLDISFEEVLKRAKKRDIPKYGIEFLEKYKKKYIPIQKKYLKENNVKEKCDIIIDNNDYNNPKIME
jgi:phosphoglycolate phosphatase